MSVASPAALAAVPPAARARVRPYGWPLGLMWATVAAMGGYVFFWSSEEEYGRG